MGFWQWVYGPRAGTEPRAIGGQRSDVVDVRPLVRNLQGDWVIQGEISSASPVGNVDVRPLVRDSQGEWVVNENYVLHGSTSPHSGMPPPEEELQGGSVGGGAFVDDFVVGDDAVLGLPVAEMPVVQEGGDPMDVDEAAAEEAVAPEEGPWQPDTTQPLRTTTFKDIVGWTSFKRERQLNASASHAVAAYRSFDPIDGEHIPVEARVNFVESIKQGVNKLVARPRRHNVRHRAANRYYRRVAIVKALVDKVRFESPGVFSGSDADKRSLHIIVRRVIKEALDSGVELPNTKAKFPERECAWYLKAVITSYYIREEDDEWWDRLAAEGSAITA